MDASLDLRRWTLVVLALGLALFVAFTAAGRGDAEFGDGRNDTFGYQEHFECLAKGGSLGECDPLISTNATEYLYPGAVAAIAKVAGPQNFYAFKFVFALSVSFMIFLSCALLSKVPSLTLLLLVLDFRFWEYVANSLRNGLAIALFVSIFAYYKLRARPIPLLAKLAAGAAHSGALILALAPRRKLGGGTLVLLFAVCGVILAGSSLLVPLLSGVAWLGDKFAFYLMLVKDNSAGFALPLHYVAIFIVMARFYMKSDDQAFIEMFNVLLVLLVFSVALNLLNLSYRSISLMLPFLAIGVTYPLEAWRLARLESGQRVAGEQDGRHLSAAGFGLMYVLVVAAFAFALARNFEAVQIHLS